MDADSWARWRGEIAKACDGEHWTLEKIEDGLRQGRSHALLREDCCLIVEVHDYPGAKACQVMWAAGDIDALLKAAPHVEDWARAQGCTEMLIEGHPGWERALRTRGYARWSVTVRKGL